MLEYRARRKGLEPTYEGLKRSTPREASSELPRLEPTYEGLKRRAHMERIARRLYGLEPTYEGLKRTALEREAVKAIRVWSLPMRD